MTVACNPQGWTLASGSGDKTVNCAVLFFGLDDVGVWQAIAIHSYVESAAGTMARFIAAILRA